MRQALWPDCPEERHKLEMEELSHTDGVVLVAEDEGPGVCGFAEVSIRHDHVDGTSAVPVPYLEGWFVEGEFRGRGVGRQLMSAVEQWAREHGFSELASDAELENPEGIRAHIACGFKEACRAVHFIKRIAN
jgi:aminoglycoside 6'-N-acetyltransferase I